MFLEENFGEPGTNHMLHHDVCGSRVSQIAPHPTLSPHRPTAQARWDLAGRGSETLCAVLEVMRAPVVHSLSPFLRGEGGVRGCRWRTDMRVMLAALGLLFWWTANGAAQEFPNKPLTMVIPFAAGGPTDVLGRVVAQRMSEVLGQQV